MGHPGSPKGAGAALELLHDHDSLLRKFAVFSLVETDVERAASILPKLLGEDPDITVRRALTTAMGLDPKRFIAALVEDAANPQEDTEARLLALTALNDVESRSLGEFAARLATVLDVAQPVDVQIAAVRLLGKIDPERARLWFKGFRNKPNLDPEVKKALDAFDAPPG